MSWVGLKKVGNIPYKHIELTHELLAPKFKAKIRKSWKERKKKKKKKIKK